MALTIQGATVGYDTAGISTLLSKIKADAIDQAVDQMDNSFSNLTDAIDEIWVGHSADQFKTNMENDKNKITGAMNEAYHVLEVELSQIEGRMGEVDEALVKSNS